jgi:TIR domain
MNDIFISYNVADRDWAAWVAWILEEAGYSVVVQDWDFRPGDNFVLRMDEAVRASDKTVLLLSNNFLRSRFTPPEWAAAFVADPTGSRHKIIPIKVAECDPEGLLRTLVHVDLVGLNEAAATTAVLQAFRPRAKPVGRPSFPPGRGKNPAVFPVQSETAESRVIDARHPHAPLRTINDGVTVRAIRRNNPRKHPDGQLGTSRI